MDSRVSSTAFRSSLPPNPNPNPNPIPITDPTSSSDLPTTISLLKSLISFANSTLTSISDLLPLSALPSFIPCPFNSCHRLPPESLFRHSLLCSSAPGSPLLDPAFLDSLRYPISSQSAAETTFPLSNPAGDLALSFDEPLDGSGSSFFYKGCHGVVAFPQSDASRRVFMLPAFLLSECSDFVAESSVDDEEEKVRVFGILPSDFFSLRCEVSAWIHWPVSYSYTVLRVASGLRKVDVLRLKRWIIMNSAVSGVVIDAPMRDHVFLLLKLCLKVIEREALCNLELHFRKDEFLDRGDRSFECPKLVGSLNWLASQLSVLYGDRNGNSFAVGMVKESLLCAGSCLMLFKIETDKFRQDSCGSGEGVDVDVDICESENSKLGKHFQAGSEINVSVSRVIAAVSALHERSLLEEKIRFLRFGRPITKAQLITEHSFISTRSIEERTMRPEYKAVLEHDGLLWQRAQDQGARKGKTKEELLAEERDYKRRRMSYRGKKVKRTHTQVIRDIIDEHMEEIKQAGGIGCGVKATQEMARTAGFYEVETRSGTIETEEGLSFHRKSLHGEYNANSGVHGDVCSKDVSNTDHIMQKPYDKWRHQEDYRKRNNDRVQNCGSRNPSHSNDGHPHKKYADCKAGNYDEECSSKYDSRDQGYSVKSEDHQARSTFTSTSAKILAVEEHHHASKGSNRHRDRNSVSRRSASVRPNGFEDRYNPCSSHDEYDTAYTNVSAGSNSARSGRYLGSPDDDKYENEPHKGEIAAKRRKWDHHAK